MAKKEKNKVKVHLPKMIHKDLLTEHPRNSNRQSRHTFKELRKSIRENGFDEVLTIVPRDDGAQGYYIVSGNHRMRAGVAENMDEFPCIVRDDWDEVQQQVELVRRNYVRGDIDRDSFTTAVNTLAEEKALSLDEIRDMMGFEDPDTFLRFYKEEEKKVQQALEMVQKTSSAPQIKMIDDMGLILSSIFEQYGNTVPNSFIIFPAGQKKHMFVAATPALVRTLKDVAEHCIANHLDINIVLGGLLVIGMDQANFTKSAKNKKEVLKKGTENGQETF